MVQRPHLSTLVFVVTSVILALSCTVQTDPLTTFDEPESISFVVDDGMDDGIALYKTDGSGNYQTDRVQVTITKGPVDLVQIYYSTGTGLAYASQDLQETSTGSQVFEAEVEVSPYPTTWFIGARSTTLNASTQYGTVLDPLTAQKYLNKEEADDLIRDQLSTLRSRGEFATLFPSTAGNVYSYPMVLPAGNTLNVDLDFYVDLFANDVQHTRYGIEYSERLNSDGTPVVGVSTNTYLILEQQPAQDMGYVIISAGNTDQLKEVLLSPDFFPETDRDFLEAIHY